MSVDRDRLWIEQFRKNLNYRVDLIPPAGRSDLEIIYAHLTAPIILDTKSNWGTFVETPFKEWSPIMQVMTGRSTQVWLATEQAWMGTEPITFQLQFALLAVDDAEREVLQPSQNLLMWTLPKDRTDPIEPPVPQLHLKRGASLWIGYNIFIQEALLPQSVQVSYSTVMDPHGYPIRADITMGFVTMSAVSAVELSNWFRGSGGGPSFI